MIITVIGKPDSGKSRRAEELICSLSENKDRYYIATMIPFGDEGRERVEKHRLMRAEKSFTTIEQPLDIEAALAGVTCAKNSAVLLECMSNLAANEMFERRCFDIPKLKEKIMAGINKLGSSVKHLVIVSNHFERDDATDDETRLYIELMDRLNDELKKISDQCVIIG